MLIPGISRTSDVLLFGRLRYREPNAIVQRLFSDHSDTRIMAAGTMISDIKIGIAETIRRVAKKYGVDRQRLIAPGERGLEAKKVHLQRSRRNLFQYFLWTTDRKPDVIQTEGHSMKTGLASLHK